MNHKDLITSIANRTGESKPCVESVLKEHAFLVAREMKDTGGIVLHGIGALAVVDTAARKGRNPQTGEPIDIPAGKRIKLKAAKALKDAIA